LFIPKKKFVIFTAYLTQRISLLTVTSPSISL